MNLKPDKFTWIVIAVIVLLLAAAVVTVNRAGTPSDSPMAYRTDSAPDTPVYNAFVAIQNGELYKAREQYSKRVLDQMERDRYDPFTNIMSPAQTSRQLRILSVDVDTSNPDRAVVTVMEDTYTTGGPFGGGNTWSNQRAIPVIREDGQWKIDAQEFFF